MRDDKKRMMDKVRKCLALSASSNPNEAARALAQARALMHKYDIEAGDLDLLDISTFEIEECSENAAQPTAYESNLLSEIARAFACQAVLRKSTTQRRRGTRAKFEFIGKGHHAEVAGYCADVLLRQLRASMSAHVAALKAEARSEGWSLSRKEANSARCAYAMAWVAQVRAKVDALGVVKLADDDPVKRATLDATGGRKSKTRAPSISPADAESWRAGEADGAGVELHRPVDGAATTPRLADRSVRTS